MHKMNLLQKGLSIDHMNHYSKYLETLEKRNEHIAKRS